MEKFIFLEHTADIKFRAYGKTISELLENCVLAVSNHISGGQKIKSPKAEVIEVFADDPESLLCKLIDEIIFLLDAKNFLTSKAEITVRGNNLKADLYGDDAKHYKGLDHIKAATYAEMYVKKSAKGWEAQVVLDV